MEADQAALAGDEATAAAGFREAVQLALGTSDAYVNNSICWHGSLDGFAEIVLPACDRAAELWPEDGNVRDSRAVARALTGDFPGAIEDFERFLRWAEEAGLDERLIRKREVWLAELRANRNPFDRETLKGLRTEVVEFAPVEEEAVTGGTAESGGDVLGDAPGRTVAGPVPTSMPVPNPPVVATPTPTPGSTNG